MLELDLFNFRIWTDFGLIFWTDFGLPYGIFGLNCSTLPVLVVSKFFLMMDH
jgi:hypothetical protein